MESDKGIIMPENIKAKSDAKKQGVKTENKAKK